MRSKLVIALVVALVAVAAVVGVVAAARAGATTSLKPMTASELLAQMAQAKGQTQAISGEVSWTNDLLGNLSSALSSGNFGGASAQLPLVANGNGRIWVSKDGLELQSLASGGDQTIVANAKNHDVWIYDYATSSAKHYVMTGTPPAGGAPSPEPSPSALTPATITAMLQQLAAYGTFDVVSSDTSVAGQPVYVLRFTPTATDTALGSVQVAVDGTHFVPLQLQVFAKDGTAAVLQFGFTRVSFDAIPASQYDFTPPSGTKVTTKTLDANKIKAKMNGAGHKALGAGKKTKPTAAQKSALQKLMRSAFLTAGQAQKLVKFHVASAQGYTARPFDFAAVMGKGGPLTSMGKPLMSLMQSSGLMGKAGSMMSPPVSQAPALKGKAGAKMMAAGPAVTLLYGKGFGSIVLVETQTTPALTKQLGQLPALVDTTSVAGVSVRSFTTPLGGAVVWQQGGTTMLAFGMVPKADLITFAGAVK